MKTFAVCASQKISGRKNLSAKERRVLRILQDETPGPLVKMRQRRMEEHVRVGLKGELPPGKIDWSAIDWGALLDKILKILVTVLPLILDIII